MPTVTVISFGHLAGPAPTAHITVDLRQHFRDPHIDPDLRALTARDPLVREHVLATPGIEKLVTALVRAAEAFLGGPGAGDLTIAVGCADGRHCAPTVASLVAERLADQRLDVEIAHRDLPADQYPEHDQDQEPQEADDGRGVDIDHPIEMPEDADDFALPVVARSAEPDAQARARLEALIEVWPTGGFTAWQIAQALRDKEGLSRQRAWIFAELRRLEETGRLEGDDDGRWHPLR